MPVATDTRQFVVCALGAEEYGLPIGQVREIVRYVEPRPVASELPWMRGVIGLRGRLVPVHDLAERLGIAAAAAAPAVPPASAKLVIVEHVEHGGEPVGLLVDDVLEVRTVAAEQIEPVPSGSGEIARVGERLMLLLDAGELG